MLLLLQLLWFHSIAMNYGILIHNLRDQWNLALNLFYLPPPHTHYFCFLISLCSQKFMIYKFFFLEKVKRWRKKYALHDITLNTFLRFEWFTHARKIAFCHKTLFSHILKHFHFFTSVNLNQCGKNGIKSNMCLNLKWARTSSEGEKIGDSDKQNARKTIE